MRIPKLILYALFLFPATFIDYWQIINNSENNIELIAEGNLKEKRVKNTRQWKTLNALIQ